LRDGCLQPPRFALGTGAAGLTWLANQAEAADRVSAGDDLKHAAMIKNCGDKCDECGQACNKAFHHCLQQASAGKAPHAAMAQTLADCAAICALSEQMIFRHSSMMDLTCRACADACRRCASECVSFDTDVVMKTCQDTCQRCEETCREMIKAMGGDSGPAPNQPAPGRSR
jgi:hypothetical protein